MGFAGFPFDISTGISLAIASGISLVISSGFSSKILQAILAGSSPAIHANIFRAISDEAKFRN